MFLKRHISFFFLLLISFKMLIVPFVYLDFELRKEYIINHLCENRFKPQLHCEGKCYLARTLSKIAEEKAKNAAENQGENIKKVLEEVFDEQLFIVPLTTIKVLKIASIFGYQPRPLIKFASPLLRPPAFVL